MKTRTAQNIAPRDLTMTVRTSHGNLEDHAGLLLVLGAVSYCDFTVGGRRHEAQLDAPPHVVLVRLPELLHPGTYTMGCCERNLYARTCPRTNQCK